MDDQFEFDEELNPPQIPQQQQHQPKEQQQQPLTNSTSTPSIYNQPTTVQSLPQSTVASSSEQAPQSTVMSTSNMLTQPQQLHSTHKSGSKRKLTSNNQPLTLKNFVELYWSLCHTTTCTEITSTTIPNGFPGTQPPPAKRRCLDYPDINALMATFKLNGTCGSGSDGSNAVASTITIPDVVLSEGKRSITTFSYTGRLFAYTRLFNLFCCYLEEHNIPMLFSKEMLKYFLATYRKFIRPIDFSDTNTIIKDRRSSKNSTVILTNGAIIFEYCKSIESFIANLGRSDPNDVDALKFILDKGLALPSKYYEICSELLSIPMVSDEYDKTYTDRAATHDMVSVSTFKRVTILVTNCIVMQHDGHQFVTVSANIERVFNTTMLSKSKLYKTDYMILDVLIMNKIKVLDILSMRLSQYQVLPEVFADRLKLITEVLPNCKVVEFCKPSPNNDHSYIQKSKTGFGNSIIYTRSNLTAAAVGLSDKHVILAFEKTPDVLVVKTKAALASPVSYTLATAPWQQVQLDDPMVLVAPNTPSIGQPSTVVADGNSVPLNDSPVKTKPLPTIRFNDVVYQIEGLPDNANLFSYIIPVECREFNKISSLSTRCISHVSEYKPAAAAKDTALVETLKKICRNPNSMRDILTHLVQTADSTLKSELRALMDAND